MDSGKKQLTHFNRLYREFQETLNKTLKRVHDKVYNVKRIEQIEEFKKQIEENLNLFEQKDTQLFDKVLILKRIFFGKPKLSNVNTAVAWKYIEIFYTISQGNKAQLIPRENGSGVPSNLGGLENLVNDLLKDKNSPFKDLVEDISSQVAEKINGKDIDASQLLASLMSGNTSVSGINFQDIIQNTSKKLEEKMNKGEIDINNIKETSEKISKTIF